MLAVYDICHIHTSLRYIFNIGYLIFIASSVGYLNQLYISLNHLDESLTHRDVSKYTNILNELEIVLNQLHIYAYI